MSELVSISFDSEASPGLTVRRKAGNRDDLYGWGFGWYPGDDVTGAVIKDPLSTGEDAVSSVLRDWDRFRSSSFLCHLRGSTKKARQRDAQPFIKSYAGRQWIFAHNGDLHEGFAASLPLGVHPVFEPLGKSDSEHAFCWLLTCFRAEGARTLADFGWKNLALLLRQINDLGTANILLSDGQHILCHNDRNGFHPMYWLRRVPPHASEVLESDEFVVDLSGPFDRNRTMVMTSTLLLSGEPWVAMAPGQILVTRRGSVAWNSMPDLHAEPVSAATAGLHPAMPPGRMGEVSHVVNAQQATPPAIGAITVRDIELAAPVSTEVATLPMFEGDTVVPSSRLLSVVHETVYRYQAPIEHSAHVFRLRPVQDEWQRVQEHSLSLSVDGPRASYEDVFGNAATHVELSTSYQELSITGRSIIQIVETPPVRSRSISKRDLLPLVWMPWQRQMMLPYLLPPELPESELRELTEFAMSFVARNDNDLHETVLDINRTIYRDFSYVSGSTTLETTPYDVFVSRRGVCQDFANLMICLARLLNVPARYRVGYIYTGTDYENKIQSDASHAWVELYLPWNGWRGFDPTNGCTAGLDHVRVACGRNYRDATPTAGTIYKGQGAVETLIVNVRVEECAIGDTDRLLS